MLALKATNTCRRDLAIVKKLRKAKFSVYVAKANSENKLYALKVFPYENDRINHDYLNECMFSTLDHPNIIKIVDCVDERDSVHKNEHSKISYILMELAPYGDFFDVFMEKKIKFDSKLARTYFHQLIDGLEYMHNHGMAHLDLKPENLLLGENFKLKICDFDLSYMEGDEHIKSYGTRCYRAPELVMDNCINPPAADVFSSGILLFVFKCSGKIPQTEDSPYHGVNLFELMQMDPKKFWEVHLEAQERDSEFFEDDFKELFMKMTNSNPQKRPTINEIKQSSWYKKEIYSEQEVIQIMRSYYSNSGS